SEDWLTSRIANSLRKSGLERAPRIRSSVPGPVFTEPSGYPSPVERLGWLRLGRLDVEESGPVLILGVAVAQDEALHHVVRGLVGELHGRRLHEVGARSDQRAADPPVLRELRAADGVDHDAGRVGGVPDLELHLDRDRDVAEVP